MILGRTSPTTAAATTTPWNVFRSSRSLMSTEGGLSRAYDKLRVCSAFTTCDIHMSKYGGTWQAKEEGELF